MEAMLKPKNIFLKIYQAVKMYSMDGGLTTRQESCRNHGIIQLDFPHLFDKFLNPKTRNFYHISFGKRTCGTDEMRDISRKRYGSRRDVSPHSLTFGESSDGISQRLTPRSRALQTNSPIMPAASETSKISRAHSHNFSN